MAIFLHVVPESGGIRLSNVALIEDSWHKAGMITGDMKALYDCLSALSLPVQPCPGYRLVSLRPHCMMEPGNMIEFIKSHSSFLITLQISLMIMAI